jgi:agmatinase
MGPILFELINRNETPNDVNFVIFGVPSEATSTSSRAGAKEGPSAIRKGFQYFSLLTEKGIDIFQKNIVDIGNVEVYPTLMEETMGAIEDTILLIHAANSSVPAVPIALGGDHFITYPIVRTLLKISPKFGLIIFDAHVDLYDMWLYKEKYSHATVFHRILELPSVEKNDLLFIGTRDVDYEEAEFLKSNSINYVPSYSLPQENFESFIQEKLESFHDHNIENLYISIDMDALDPSIAPGTGYPIPGGLSYRQLWHCLQMIAREFKVIGFDVVEVCPTYDPSEITAITAARIITEFLGFIIENTE